MRGYCKYQFGSCGIIYLGMLFDLCVLKIFFWDIMVWFDFGLVFFSIQWLGVCIILYDKYW